MDLLILVSEWGQRNSMIKNKTIIDGTGKEVLLSDKDFELVQKDQRIHDVKLNTKPTTFFKDAMKRFVKSKSAIVGGAIVGILCILAFAVPMFTKNVGVYNVSLDGGGTPTESNMTPKLFNAGTGFWDGTVKRTHVLYDNENNCPTGDIYTPGSYLGLTTYEEFTNGVVSQYGRGGYVNIYTTNNNTNANFYSKSINFDTKNTYTFSYSVLDEQYQSYIFDGYRISLFDGNKHIYLVGNENSYSKNLEGTINISDVLKAKAINNIDASIYFDVKCPDGKIGNMFLKEVNLTTNNEIQKALLESISFNSGNEVLLRDANSSNAWSGDFGKNGYKVEFTYCDFRYDKYEYVYGSRQQTIGALELRTYDLDGKIKINIDADHCKATKDPEELARRFQILDEDCEIFEFIEQIGDATYNKTKKTYEKYKVVVGVHKYKLLGYSSMPRFIFGTNGVSKDYCKLMFTGMRLSFIIAIGVSLVNIIIGLIWGSISGYFGGWVDITMERFCDILSGLPGTVIITLCILYGRELNWGNNADLIALMIALFMTGWMGVAGRTRTQFYRYKGREYVLASRTLGAKDGRLIFKHILPNSAGTIITGSILMIPSVIFSEATISYLGLGLKNLSSLGVILSNNQAELTTNSYLLIFPSVIIALLMISFNLFGNGLRDAVNPSLKGEDE